MSRENQIEQFRRLWEQVITSGKLEVCTDELKGAPVLDVNVLRLLYSTPEIIPKEIAGKLNVPNSTLTNAINRLERKGLLERKLNANDLRSLQLILTAKGEQAIRSHHEAEGDLIGKLFDILDKTEADALLATLSKLAANL